MRLDRFLSHTRRCGRRDVRYLLAERRVTVDGVVAVDGRTPIHRFSRVILDGEILQAREARYLMLHKPCGYLSATRDPVHRTVFDLLDEAHREQLHIGGRLDFNTSGLMLITNDGSWSRRLTGPAEKFGKVYHVVTEDPIPEAAVSVFAAGMYFRYEGLTTLPAELRILAEREARLTLYEGRYHQVKRMFGYFNNRVVALHRESMGPIVLDTELMPGQYRPLTPAEIASLAPGSPQ